MRASSSHLPATTRGHLQREAHRPRQAHDRQRPRGPRVRSHLRRQDGHPDHPRAGHLHQGPHEGLRRRRDLRPQPRRALAPRRRRTSPSRLTPPAAAPSTATAAHGRPRARRQLRQAREAPPASHLTTRTAEADDITALLDEKGEKVRQLELREHSRITGTGANAQPMTARNIDLIYARRRPDAADLEADGRLGARAPGRGWRAGPAASPGRRSTPACRPTARRSRTSTRRRTSRSICRRRATRPARRITIGDAARDGRAGAGAAERGLRRRRRLHRNAARRRQDAGARPAARGPRG